MAIPFTCPHCGAQTNVDDRFAGQSGPCFQCGKTIAIPGVQQATFDSGSLARSVRPAKSNKLTIAMIVGLVVIGLCCVSGVPIALLLPAVQAARQAAWKAQCFNNLKHIGLAMHNYDAVNGCLPPPFLADADGKPMHSWRVLVLPYLDDPGAQQLYERYDFNEPWDGPNNRLLAAEMPTVFKCPATDDAGLMTDYVAVVGPGLVFDPTHPVKFADCTDGISQTIAIVESAGPTGAGVHWMSPEDLPIERMDGVINGTSGPAMASVHINGVNVLMADGAVFFLREQTDPRLWRAMLTISGGETDPVGDGSGFDDVFEKR